MRCESSSRINRRTRPPNGCSTRSRPASNDQRQGPPAPGENAPETDLVGNWRARAGDTTIDLAITEDSQFTWKAASTGKPATTLKGQLESSSDELVLESKDQGSMAGTVKSLGTDKWQFALSGAPPSDPGLSFARVK